MGGFLRWALQVKNWMGGPLSSFPFLSLGCWDLSIFYGISDVSELPWGPVSSLNTKAVS